MAKNVVRDIGRMTYNPDEIPDEITALEISFN